jgi:hypothetical protein
MPRSDDTERTAVALSRIDVYCTTIANFDALAIPTYKNRETRILLVRKNFIIKISPAAGRRHMMR